VSELLIRGGRLFDPVSGLDAVGDLLLDEDRIVAVGEVRPTGAERVIDAETLLVLPGLMDLHVHLREPGQEQKETIATGALAAAAGGFATVVAEPNTTPPRDSAARITEVLETAESAAVHVLQKGAITVGQEGQEVTDLAALRVAGAMAASDDGFSVWEEAVMREAFLAAQAAGMPLTVHVDEPRLMARDIGLSAEIDWPVHFSHVSLEEEVELIAQARARGLRVTGEAAPHHLALCADAARAGDTNFKMNPPLRTWRDREAVRKALAAGVLTVIASDHAPHTREEKERPYEQAPSGVVGLETTVGVVWTELVHAGLLEEHTAVRALTAGPAEVLGIVPPALRVGARADVTVLDPLQEWVVDVDRFYSRGRNCPFLGWRARGKAIATIVSGRLVMWEGMMMPV
jgi:dihydroorotase